MVPRGVMDRIVSEIRRQETGDVVAIPPEGFWFGLVWFGVLEHGGAMCVWLWFALP